MAACGTCHQELREGAKFCGACGQPVATGPTGKQAAGKPLRQPSPFVGASPGSNAPPRRSNTSTVVAGVLIGVMVLTGIATVALLSAGSEDRPSLTAEEASSASETEPSEDGADLEASTVTLAPAPTSTTTTTTDDRLPPGEWAALLYAATTFGPADAERAALSRFGDVRVLDSNAYTTLKPGLYVVYAGGFLRSSGALDFCRAIGRNDRALCYARYLSRDPSVTWNIPGTDAARPEFVAYP